MKQSLTKWNDLQRKSRLKYANKVRNKPKVKTRRKKSERTKWKQKAIAQAKFNVRQKGYCEWCGKTKEESQMHGSHIESVRHENTAAMEANILCLCAYCHRRRWHEHPAEAIAWFDSKWPGRRKKLRALALIVPKYTEEDWKRIYQELCEKNTPALQSLQS